MGKTLTEKVAELLKNAEMSKTLIAKKAGVSRKYLYDIMDGKVLTMSYDLAENIVNAMKVDFEELTGVKNKKAGKKIPVLGTIPAGIPIEAIEDILDYEEITQDMARQGEFFALKVKGNSMEPEIRENDIVIIRQQNTANNNDICAVMVNGYDATLKQVEITSTGLILKPFNKEYGNISFDKAQVQSLPVKIIGVMVEIRRTWKNKKF